MYKFNPEEFIVEEIALDGTIFEVSKKIEHQNAEGGKFCYFVLEKKLWNTAQALNAIARAIRGGRTRFNAAGAKDRNAITVQLCSVFGAKPEQLLNIRVKDISINGAWVSDKKVELGDLLGNKFTITLTEQNVGKKISAEQIQQNAERNHFLFPNYFGYQRFGSLRMNSHLVGKALLTENWKEAVLNYLTYTDENERNQEAVAGRKRLAEELDFKKALGYFSPHLKFERTMIGHLAQHPTDYIGAFRKLPRHTMLLFVHAFQSYLFNEVIKKKIAGKTLFSLDSGEKYCEAELVYGFPQDEKIKTADRDLSESVVNGKVFPLLNLVGYESEITDVEKELLEKEGMTQSQFKLKSIPELSSKGTLRASIAPISHFAIVEKEPAKVTFCLSSGNYATVALESLLGKAT